jgi:hypothetical protein
VPVLTVEGRTLNLMDYSCLSIVLCPLMVMVDYFTGPVGIPEFHGLSNQYFGRQHDNKVQIAEPLFWRGLASIILNIGTQRTLLGVFRDLSNTNV